MKHIGVELKGYKGEKKAVAQLTKTAANNLWILQAEKDYCESLFTCITEATELQPLNTLRRHFLLPCFCEQKVKPHSSSIT